MRPTQCWADLVRLLIAICSFFVMLGFSACEKDDPSGGSNVTAESIWVSPTIDTLDIGITRTYSAWQIMSNNLDTLAAHVEWSLVGFPVGTIVAETDSTVELLAQAFGDAILVAQQDALIDTAFLHIRWPSPFHVFNDEGFRGFAGTYHGSNDQIEMAMMTAIDAPEGQLVLQADFTVTEQGWVGLYVEEGGAGGSEVVNLEDFLPQGHLRFSYRTYIDLQIGVRADNISAGSEASKLWLCEDAGGVNDGAWHDISIPLSEFWNRQQASRFDRMEVLLSVSILGEALGEGRSGSFWIDNVRWSRD